MHGRVASLRGVGERGAVLGKGWQPVVELATGIIHGYEAFAAEAIAGLRGMRLFTNAEPANHEGALVLEVREPSPHLASLRARGVKLALVAFGAGCSSFAAIAELGPMYVKLDRALTAGVRRHSRQHRLLCSLAALCTAQGAQVIAEGVDTREEMLAVISAGIPLAQGQFAASWSPS